MTVSKKITDRVWALGECLADALLNITLRDARLTVVQFQEGGEGKLCPSRIDLNLAAVLGGPEVIDQDCVDPFDLRIGTETINAHCTEGRRGVTLTKDIKTALVSGRHRIVASGRTSEEQLQAVGRDTAKPCWFSNLFEPAGTTVITDWRTAFLATIGSCFEPPLGGKL